MEANGQVNPKTSPFSSYLFTTGGAPAATAQIYRSQCGRFCCHRRMGPTTAESPTCARSDKCGTVTDGRDATVVLSHPLAAAHAASSARGCRLKRRASAAPHESGHVAHHQRKTRARDSRLCVVFESRRNIPLRVSLPSKESHFEALLIRGSKSGLAKVRQAPRSPESGTAGMCRTSYPRTRSSRHPTQCSRPVDGA